ncbi:tolB protein precursor [Halorhodospira halochloris]|uniref:Tol-Pal system protein TolB n=1 Tax=Halorhodospira halochloris TaxID=1052 RepID=A0A0X8X7G0_HALHR|nr:Tol-Pal system beta propeller repeat protein TolB [Halorhodospira halochloris]MBK1652289.1 Tol-Pal system beta propeller repeat protein TolB [Halorhodospira halochloris]BAU56914.1 tolB protein precursor [Halorhodospira halochloris]
MANFARAWILLIFLVPAAVLAEEQDIVIDIVGGIEGATPIAVVPFAYDGQDIGDEVQIAQIISTNLARSGRFDLLPEQDMVAEPSRLEQVQFATWRALGMDYLVLGNIRSAGDERVEVRFELLDVFRGQRSEGRRFQASQANLRLVAHTISDLIYENITGIEGAYNTRIAYVAVDDAENREERKYRLVVADSDGHGGQTILSSDEPLLSPAWSPNRDRIAYVSFEGRRSEIFVQDIATGERERLASFRGINSAPSWSPDGERIAVTLSRDGAANIYLIELGSGEVTALTDHWAIDTEAAWSPDGESLYFTSDRGGRPQIYRMDSDGGNIERVTFEGNYNARPSISPDGEKLAMVHQRDGDFYIAIKDLESETLQVVSDGPADESPSFAPNGEMVIFTAGGREGTKLSTASTLGQAVIPLTPTERDNTRVREPAW